MCKGQRIAAAVAVGVLLWIGSALAQGKPTCTPQGKLQTAQKVVGQVVKVDAGLDKLTVQRDGARVPSLERSASGVQGRGSHRGDAPRGPQVSVRYPDALPCGIGS
jgi:hypothetical protein